MCNTNYIIASTFAYTTATCFYGLYSNYKYKNYLINLKNSLENSFYNARQAYKEAEVLFVNFATSIHPTISSIGDYMKEGYDINSAVSKFTEGKTSEDYKLLKSHIEHLISSYGEDFAEKVDNHRMFLKTNMIDKISVYESIQELDENLDVEKLLDEFKIFSNDVITSSLFAAGAAVAGVTKYFMGEAKENYNSHLEDQVL